MTDTEIEIKGEGQIIDAFPRQTSQDTPPVTPKTDEKPPETVEVPTTPTPPAVETPVAPATEVIPPATEAQPAKPTAEVKVEPDFKKKFSESARRNQIVESQFTELKKVLGDITKQEVPTDEEMVALIPDWEYLSDREKNSERKLLVLDRRQNHIINTIGKIASETELVSALDQFVSNEPRLKGREDDFVAFATDPRNSGAAPEVLLSAFLFEETPIVTPAVETPPTEIPPSLERGNPSGDMPPAKTGDEQMSDEDLKVLRTTNPRKYNDMIRTGKIK